MKNEKDLISRLNNKTREIPIERGEPLSPEGVLCEECDNTTCPSHPDYQPDVAPTMTSSDEKSPYQKMSPSEQAELKDLLEKSKTIFNNTVNKIKDNWEDFQKDNNLRDEELLKRWKQYKEKVSTWIDEHKKFPTFIAKAMLLDEYDEKQEAEQLPWNEKTFRAIIEQMFDLYHRKNADYGDAFAKSFKKFGMQSTLMRLTDKYNRLESLSTGKEQLVNNESVEDTLMDIANYAIMTLIELKSQKEK